jgi:hypothetical protein
MNLRRPVRGSFLIREKISEDNEEEWRVNEWSQVMFANHLLTTHLLTTHLALRS